MSNSTLQFGEQEKVGTVISVDTGRVLIEAVNHTVVTRMSVSNLVAIQGSATQEYLIGIVDRITRTVEEQALLEQEGPEGHIPIGEAQHDLVRAVVVGTFKARKGSRRNFFKRGADSFPQIDRDCFLIEAGNLQLLMTIFSADLKPEEQLRVGHYVSDASAIAFADGNKLFQRHAAIVGSTGSGKSWSVALVLERASKLSYPNLIVLDMHGEYKPLAAKGGFADGFRVAGPADLDTPTDDVLFLPYWLLNREEMLAMIVDRSDQNAPNQAARFTHHVSELKEKTLSDLGKQDVLDTFTVDSPIPYDLNQLLSFLQSDDGEMVIGSSSREKQGPFHGKLTRFISRLQAKVNDRRYGFLFQPPTKSMDYAWLESLAERFLASKPGSLGIKIVDFSEVPSDVLPVVVGLFARLLYDIQFWLADAARTPLTFICDEAHLYLPTADEADAIARRALESFERIAKEGRKYGVSLLVVSQRPSDVSRTILSQCNNFIALRLTNDQDQNVISRLIPESMAGLTEILPLLDIGEALLLGDAVVLPTRVRLDEPTVKPSSATREFWADWQSQSPSIDAIKRAVAALRKQSRN